MNISMMFSPLSLSQSVSAHPTPTMPRATGTAGEKPAVRGIGWASSLMLRPHQIFKKKGAEPQPLFF
jgi:hypothetical protein